MIERCGMQREGWTQQALRVLTVLPWAALVGLSASKSAPAQIFVTDYSGDKISQYNFDGTTANPSLVTGLSGPWGIAISGGSIFVVNGDNSRVGMYTTAGGVQNASLITGLGFPQAIAVSGNTLFVSTQSSTQVAQYTVSGTTATLVNAALVTGLAYITGITVSGSNLFVLDGGNYVADGSGKVAMYAFSGGTATPVNTSLITGLNVPSNMAMHGANLFITSFYHGEEHSGSVLKYTVSGATATGGTLINTPRVELPSAVAVSSDGSSLFVVNSGPGGPTLGSIGQFTTSGATVDESLATNLSSSLSGIAVMGGAAPTVSITQWRSARTHGGTPQSIVLSATATGNGLTGPTVEPRSGGIRQIEIVFSGAITLANTGAISVIGRTNNGGSPGSPVSYTPGVTLSGSSTMVLSFPPFPSSGFLPDQTCYTITIPPAAINQTLTGDTDVMLRALAGDATGSGNVNLSDPLVTKARIGQPVATNARFDIDLSGGITNLDAVTARARVSFPPSRAPCP